MVTGFGAEMGIGAVARAEVIAEAGAEATEAAGAGAGGGGGEWGHYHGLRNCFKGSRGVRKAENHWFKGSSQLSHSCSPGLEGANY